MWRTEDIGALCHKMHAAENNIISLWLCGSQLCKLKGITSIICILDDFVTLIVVPKDYEAFAQAALALVMRQ